jgi:glycoside/pentoside/hexuronide:cation symporter, GPH family
MTPAADTGSHAASGWRWKAVFAVGVIAEVWGANATKRLAVPIYNIIFGVSPALVGLALTLMRFWDAMTDPVMGVISDNARTRWGRRRPFILVGGLLCGVVFPLIWMPPSGWSEYGKFGWLLGTLLLFYSVYTVFVVPYGALALELAPTPRERTRLLALRGWVGSLAVIGIAWSYPLSQAKIFPAGVVGIVWVGIGMGAIMAVASAVPALGLREPHAQEVRRQPTVRLIASLRLALRVRPFRVLLGMVAVVYTGFYLIDSLGVYVNTYHVHGGDVARAAIVVGWTGLCYAISALIALPLLSRFAQRRGKRATINVCFGFLIVANASKWFVYTPEWPALQLVTPILLAPGLSGLGFVIQAMLADVCDYDEWANGLRREGMFSSLCGWVTKTGLSVSFLGTGLILTATGYAYRVAAALRVSANGGRGACLDHLPALHAQRSPGRRIACGDRATEGQPGPNLRLPY